MHILERESQPDEVETIHCCFPDLNTQNKTVLNIHLSFNGGQNRARGDSNIICLNLASFNSYYGSSISLPDDELPLTCN